MQRTVTHRLLSLQPWESKPFVLIPLLEWHCYLGLQPSIEWYSMTIWTTKLPFLSVPHMFFPLPHHLLLKTNPCQTGPWHPCTYTFPPHPWFSPNPKMNRSAQWGSRKTWAWSWTRGSSGIRWLMCGFVCVLSRFFSCLFWTGRMVMWGGVWKHVGVVFVHCCDTYNGRLLMSTYVCLSPALHVWS